jgi:hypothetical protein
VDHQPIGGRADEGQHSAQARRALGQGRQGDGVAIPDQGGHADTGCLEAKRFAVRHHVPDQICKLLVGQLFGCAIERLV